MFYYWWLTWCTFEMRLDFRETAGVDVWATGFGAAGAGAGVGGGGSSSSSSKD